jgi:hypothetical protein
LAPSLGAEAQDLKSEELRDIFSLSSSANEPNLDEIPALEPVKHDPFSSSNAKAGDMTVEGLLLQWTDIRWQEI